MQLANIVFGGVARDMITPGVYTLGAIMSFADTNNESIIPFDVLSIVALFGICAAGPIFTVFGARMLFRKIQSRYRGNELSLIKN